MYSIVRAFTLDKLAKEVNEMMEEGYIPTGGVFPCSEYDWFGQAMIKDPVRSIPVSEPPFVLDPVEQTDIVVAISQRPVEAPAPAPVEAPAPAPVEAPAPAPAPVEAPAPATKKGRR